MAAIPGNVTLWPGRRVPYEFAPNFPFEQDVLDAMCEWQATAMIHFDRRQSGDQNYLIIKETSGKSSSPIGMQGGAQDVIINQGFLALHELGHALGLIHEQCRSDRDSYITLEWGNIYNGQSNPEFQLNAASNNLTPYDIKSVMHYPAPATGWQGIPDNKEVWTMRWRSNQNTELGAGNYQGWSSPSLYDLEGLDIAYSGLDIPMGPETAHGYWHNQYAVQFPYSVGGRHFFYGQNLNNDDWFIQEFLLGGRMGCETETGSWNLPYRVKFPFSINGQQFFYGQEEGNADWIIMELLPSGKMGGLTNKGTFSAFYELQFPFSINGQQFFYAQDGLNNNWFIRELLPGGKMGSETDNGTSTHYDYFVQFPFTTVNGVFLYGQNPITGDWVIKELLSGGKMGNQVDQGTSRIGYETQFPYTLYGNQYFYGQNLATNHWFIRRLNDNGTMGDLIQTGVWKYPYAVQFPFEIGNKQYFYGQNVTKGTNWFIQELLPV